MDDKDSLFLPQPSGPDAEADVFDVVMHYPLPVFRYSFSLAKPSKRTIYELFKILSEMAPLIPLPDNRFIMLDEIDVKDIKYELPPHLKLKSIKLEEVYVPKGEELVDIFLHLYRYINPYRFFHPSVHSNPIAMKLEEKGIEKSHEKWKKFNRFATFMKNRVILLRKFEGQYIGVMIYRVEFQEGEIREGMDVKVRGKPLYGRVKRMRDGRAVVELGIFEQEFSLNELHPVKYIYDFQLKKSDYRYIIDYFMEELENETIKYGFSLERTQMEFEKLPQPNLESAFSDLKVKLEFEKPSMREKLNAQALPFQIDDDASVSVFIDRKLLSQINRGNLKHLYMRLIEKVIPFDMEHPRIYSSILVHHRLNGGRSYVGGGFYSAICKTDHAALVGWYLKNFRGD